MNIKIQRVILKYFKKFLEIYCISISMSVEIYMYNKSKIKSHVNQFFFIPSLEKKLNSVNSIFFTNQTSQTA